MTGKRDRIILKIFDSRFTGERKAHNCSTCQSYKREIRKGNREALEFYKWHINELVKKYKGATIVIDKRQSRFMLPSGADSQKSSAGSPASFINNPA